MNIDLNDLSLTEMVSAVIVTYLILMAITGAIKKILNGLDLFHVKKSKEEALEETIKTNSKDIEELAQKQKVEIKNTNDKIDKITDMLMEYIEHDMQDKQVLLRRDINEIYNMTLRKGYIIEKDLKTYNYALKRYLANNGNSYVVDEIVPRMKEFRVYLSDKDAQTDIKRN